jgi:hypothetical protein
VYHIRRKKKLADEVNNSSSFWPQILYTALYYCTNTLRANTLRVIELYILTVHYNDSRLSPTVFEHVDRIIQDDDLIWLEFKPPLGWPPGAGAVLQSAAVKELKVECEMTEMPA